MCPIERPIRVEAGCREKKKIHCLLKTLNLFCCCCHSYTIVILCCLFLLTSLKQTPTCIWRMSKLSVERPQLFTMRVQKKEEPTGCEAVPAPSPWPHAGTAPGLLSIVFPPRRQCQTRPDTRPRPLGARRLEYIASLLPLHFRFYCGDPWPDELMLVTPWPGLRPSTGQPGWSWAVHHGAGCKTHR